MRTRWNLRPEVESLEAMALLSGAGAALHAAVATVPPSMPAPSHQLHLSGMATGNYRAREIPDAGKTYMFFGHGNVMPLGRTDVTGTDQLPGLIVTPVSATPTVNAHGQLFLSNARGTLTLTLSAPSHDNAESLPPFFTYSITNASGSFRGDTGSGVVVIVADPAPQSSTPTTTTTMPTLPTEHGTFTMVFVPNPPSPSATGTSTS